MADFNEFWLDIDTEIEYLIKKKNVDTELENFDFSKIDISLISPEPTSDFFKNNNKKS